VIYLLKIQQIHRPLPLSLAPELEHYAENDWRQTTRLELVRQLVIREAFAPLPASGEVTTMAR
jgi:hypothetical protein